jgi:hypothetical protein
MAKKQTETKTRPVNVVKQVEVLGKKLEKLTVALSDVHVEFGKLQSGLRSSAAPTGPHPRQLNAIPSAVSKLLKQSKK